MIVNLFTEDMEQAFAQAPRYRKSVIVDARKTTKEEKLDTILASGVHETSRIVPIGSWVITNPGGEEYAVSEEKFLSRYEANGDGRWRAKGVIRAFRNPTGEDVEIMAPWGEPQYGDKDCLFATSLINETEISNDRYIIGGTELADTYELY